MENTNFLFNLTPQWALGADKNQWMVMKSVGVPGARQTWQSVSFVGSNTRILRRVIAEHQITPTPEAETALERLPSRFLQFKANGFQS